MPSVDVRFGLTLRHDGWIPEDELGSEVPDDVTNTVDLEGAVVVKAEDAPEVRFEDALAPLALWLCFNAVVDLVANHPATVEAYSYHGKTLLVPDDGRVQIAGDFAPSVSVDRQALQRGLVDCGERIAAFFHRLGPPYDENAKLLEPRARAAREALASAEG